jgi:type II secretory pathway pseudopilin PulG
MIVIVIISLLAVTLVPKLTGAQARSRDASRTASLVSMKAVLTAYYDDYSEYPLNTHDDISG